MTAAEEPTGGLDKLLLSSEPGPLISVSAARTNIPDDKAAKAH